MRRIPAVPSRQIVIVSGKLPESLYPPLTPTASGMLAVSDLHAIHFEETGNPQGKPVVILHGGPGAGCNPLMRRFHDPQRYRIVLFDQRGSGRSTPNAELRENTIWDLVADMEKLRRHLHIERWQVFGGSWGSTLALAYAERHPEHVIDLVLRGIFFSRQREIDWLYKSGASEIFPEAFERFLSALPAEDRQDPVPAYHRLLTDEDRGKQMQAARTWSAWEAETLSLMPDPERVRAFREPGRALAFARIECHYFMNQGFISNEDDLLANAGRIAHLPAAIVNGRYDVVTPVHSSWLLHKALPRSELSIIDDAGHAMTEPGIIKALIRATNAFATD